MTDPIKPQKARNLTAQTRVEAALDLLAILTGARGRYVGADVLMHDMALTSDQLDEVIALIQELSDSGTGARALVYRDGDAVVMEGDAAEVDPLRLTAEEARAVATVLTRHNIDRETRSRIAAATMPGGTLPESEAPSESEALFGRFYQHISYAMKRGFRIRMRYRSAGDRQARLRLIDPWRFTGDQGIPYLIAWDVEADAQKTYRLDRIEDVEVGGANAQAHAFYETVPSESLPTTGEVAWVSAPSRPYLEALGWAGLDLSTCAETSDGAEAAVHYTASSWLFDQILASGGSLRLIAPEPLRERLTAYAKQLVIEG